MKPGPTAEEQLRRLKSTWRQGEHVLVSGGTGSGKTELARHIGQIRVDAGGFLIVFVCKIQGDETIEQSYKGFTRWQAFKKRGVRRDENQILLWPDLKGLPPSKALAIQREVFTEAAEKIAANGNWTVHWDEALYTCAPEFLNMKPHMAISHALGRSSGVTNIVLSQRPSHIPLVVYGSASHAFVGRTRETGDVKRLQELGGREGSRELGNRIAGLSRHEFLWVPVAPDWPAEVVDLSK